MSYTNKFNYLDKQKNNWDKMVIRSDIRQWWSLLGPLFGIREKGRGVYLAGFMVLQQRSEYNDVCGETVEGNFVNTSWTVYVTN